VLIVDDSALVRSMLMRVLTEASDIEVVGGAKDPYEARELIIEYRPDVIILDIEMPRMDGITFLKKLMAHYPVPVIMCSGAAPANSEIALKAIEAGAVELVTKPAQGGNQALRHLGQELAEKIRAAAMSRPARPQIPAKVTAPPSTFKAAGLDPTRYLIAVGASTGGTEAIRATLSHFPADSPPITIVQHMPEGFTYSFATRLDEFCRVSVSEAIDGDLLIPGKAVLARGGVQMRVESGGGRLRAVYGNSELVNRHCPSVDVLFESVARISGKGLIGILLTGMGADGAQGLLTMRKAGAVTIGQSQQSSVVYGMPKVAHDIGAVQHQCAPGDVAKTMIQSLRALKNRRTPSSVAG
jgi:two-component system chemotaxis response regulator CheB